MGDSRYLYGPTPAEAAAHMDAGGVVERQSHHFGTWRESLVSAAGWRAVRRQDVPRHGFRLLALTEGDE